MYNKWNQHVYDRLEWFIVSKIGLSFLVLWAFSEASFWFIAPDFLLIIYSCVKPAHYKKFVLYALMSSLVGGIVYYILNLLYPLPIENILKQTPFVTPRMFDYVNTVYSQKGYLGILYQSFSFMAFKIWTFLAIQHNFSPFYFFPLVIISRFIRLFIVSVVAAFIGKKIQGLVKKHIILLVTMYSILFWLMLTAIEN